MVEAETLLTIAAKFRSMSPNGRACVASLYTFYVSCIQFFYFFNYRAIIIHFYIIYYFYWTEPVTIIIHIEVNSAASTVLSAT